MVIDGRRCKRRATRVAHDNNGREWVATNVLPIGWVRNVGNAGIVDDGTRIIQACERSRVGIIGVEPILDAQCAGRAVAIPMVRHFAVGIACIEIGAARTASRECANNLSVGIE